MTTLRTIVAIWFFATLVGCTNPSSTPMVVVFAATTENAVPTATATTTIAPTSSSTPRPTTTHTPHPMPLPTLPALSREESQLPNVLTRFGIPSQIRFSGYGSTSHSDQFGVYKLRVEYEALQFAIEYSGTTVKDSTGFLACPMFGQVIGLQAQSNVDLPAMEKMRAQELYKEFTQSNHAICIRVVESQTAVFPPDFSSTVYHADDDARLVNLLTTKNGCDLPCWWGVTPGVTSWREVQQMFLSYGKAIDDFAWASSRAGHQVGIFGRQDPYPFDHIIWHTFYEENGVVNYLRATGEVFEDSPSRHFAEDWRQYSLSQILTRLGTPSHVFLNYYQRGCPDTYDLGVAYDKLGVLIEYSGAVQRGSGKVIICPRQETTTRINLCLMSPTLGIALEQEFKNGCWFSRSAVLLDEVTKESPAVFYSQYVDPDAQTCLEIPEESGALCP